MLLSLYCYTRSNYHSKYFTLDDIRRYENNFRTEDWRDISKNPNLTIDFIREFKDRLDWIMVTVNKTFSMDDVVSNPDLPWSFPWISQNEGITVSDLAKYGDEEADVTIPFDYYIVSQYAQSLDFQYVQDRLDYDWDWDALTSRSEFSIDTIEKTKDNEGFEWDICLSTYQNPTMIWEMANSPKYYRDDLRYVYADNPNLTFDIVTKGLEEGFEWSLYHLSKNLFEEHPYFKDKQKRENEYTTVSTAMNTFRCDGMDDVAFKFMKGFFMHE